MATYIIGEEIEIERTAGDTSEIEITFPDAIDITTYSFHFAVFNKTGWVKIFEKTSFVTDGQTITCAIAETDTKNMNSSINYWWELEMYNTTEVHTVGRGKFTVHAERIVETRIT